MLSLQVGFLHVFGHQSVQQFFSCVCRGLHLVSKAARAGESFTEPSCKGLAIMETWKSLAAYGIDP